MRSEFMIPPLKRLGKNGIHRIVAKRKTTIDLKERGVYLDNALWTDELKVEHFKRHGYHYI